MNCIFGEVTVGADVERVETLSFKSSYVKRSFEDSIVVVIPVICIRDTIVVVVEWVCSITTIKSFQ